MNHVAARHVKASGAVFLVMATWRWGRKRITRRSDSCNRRLDATPRRLATARAGKATKSTFTTLTVI
jgi:hypothetical protein